MRTAKSNDSTTDFDVDIVVLWVDGNDPEWKKEKAIYEGKNIEEESNTDNRYRDWDLMRYWFRAVEAYAPWVRKIHFVTWGHVPDFLNINCEKINIVNHKDFMPEEYLPTYSSKALELNLFRIKDLAEHFIYFNDDMFFCRPVEKSDFFDLATGLPKHLFGEMPVRMVGISPWSFDNISCVGIINKHFNKHDIKLRDYFGKYVSRKYPASTNLKSLALKALFPEYYTGFKNNHSATPLLKKTYRELWNAEKEVLDKTSRARFRETGDPNQWALQYWQLASGCFLPSARKEVVFDANKKTADKICDTIIKKEADIICINDPKELSDYETIATQIRIAFEGVLPYKSCYEVKNK